MIVCLLVARPAITVARGGKILDHYKELARITTVKGARTSFYSSEVDRLFLRCTPSRLANSSDSRLRSRKVALLLITAVSAIGAIFEGLKTVIDLEENHRTINVQ